MFNRQALILPHWQDSAENFAPHIADFTGAQYSGADMCANLPGSYPVIARRDLKDIIGAMLRPENQWFFLTVQDEEDIDHAAREWLESRTELQRRITYDPAAKFKRATGEADDFYVVTGQACISKEVRHENVAMLFRAWHLRDLAWCENAYGVVDTIHRKWKPSLRELDRMFPGKLHAVMQEKLKTSPYDYAEIRHCIVPSDYYAPAEKRGIHPFTSVYVDVQNEHIIEETGKWTKMYTIPRWLTVPGSQFSYSPAVLAGLPSARALQAITLTMLQAGEKTANPPTVHAAGALRGDLQLYAGGSNPYDPEYDERTGEVIRPIPLDKSGLQFGIALAERSKMEVVEAFYLNKLNLTPIDPQMTAYQVSQILQDNMRKVLAVMGPTETEYNADLCDDVFEELFRAGAFGADRDIPESLSGEKISFRFESPLHRSIERQKGQELQEALQMISGTAAFDPQAPMMLRTRKALREALIGVGTPADWLASEDEMEQYDQQAAKKAELANFLNTAQAGATVAKTVGEAGQAMNGAMGAA